MYAQRYVWAPTDVFMGKLKRTIWRIDGLYDKAIRVLDLIKPHFDDDLP